jgi:AraC-like DNA-binding protein
MSDLPTGARLPGLDPATERWRQAFLAGLADPDFAMWALFDRDPGMLFLIKDRDGRYVGVSESCVARCGLRRKADAIGRTAHDLFPRELADSYVRQDQALLRTGRPVVDNLELTLYRDRHQGWCLSNKVPLRDRSGRIVGIACMDRDLVEAAGAGLIDGRFAAAIAHLQDHSGEPQRLPALARMAGLSQAQFDRRMRRVFGISTRQFLTKARIDAAAQALAHSDAPVSAIALATGFCDQSALTRQFRRATGFAPRQYRQMMRRNGRSEN